MGSVLQAVIDSKRQHRSPFVAQVAQANKSRERRKTVAWWGRKEAGEGRTVPLNYCFMRRAESCRSAATLQSCALKESLGIRHKLALRSAIGLVLEAVVKGVGEGERRRTLKNAEGTLQCWQHTLSRSTMPVRCASVRAAQSVAVCTHKWTGINNNAIGTRSLVGRSTGSGVE